MSRSFVFAIVYVSATQGVLAAAPVSKYNITAAEQAACLPDAQRLCAGTYPDEDKMIVCIKANQKALSPTCGPVFTAGLKKRGLL